MNKVADQVQVMGSLTRSFVPAPAEIVVDCIQFEIQVRDPKSENETCHRSVSVEEFFTKSAEGHSDDEA